MADAIISVVAQRLTAIVEEQIRKEVNLVRGVDEDLLNLSDELKRVRNLLDDADRRGFKDKGIKDWLKRLEDASYEMDDVLDEWSISLLKFQMEQRRAPPKQKVYPCIPHSSCLCFKKVANRRDIAIKIKNVKAKLDMILEEKDRYNLIADHGNDSFGELGRVTTSLVEIDEVKGRGYDKDILVRKLIGKDAAQLGINVVSIVGTGGIGKTTLAQLVYNDSRVKACFPLRIWICVSDPFDEAKIAKDIVKSVRMSYPETNQLDLPQLDLLQLDLLLKLVIKSISGKKFLLVLDDVWTDEDTKWRPLKTSLKHGEAGSSVLVTTRNEKVAIMMGTIEDELYRLGQLSDEDCWLLLHRVAFYGRSEEKFKGLLDIGRKIAHKCKGLPLAAKVLGSLLRYKNTVEAWENVLNSEIWQLEEAKLDLFPHLFLSYNDLSPALKRCLSYCAVFPKDHEINVDKLIGNWIALGYLSSDGNVESDLELRGREYFDNLVMRSLLQDFRMDEYGQVIVRCKMHDIVHDFAQFLRESDCLKSSDGRMEKVLVEKTISCQVCDDPSLVSRMKEYRSLFFQEKQLSLHICDCLRSLRVLSLVGCGLQSIPVDIEKLIHLRDLDLTGNRGVSGEDLKSICKNYNLQTLLLSECNLEEIPTEIANLVQLRHLDLSYNYLITKLPESICDLHELRILNIFKCFQLSELPQGIDSLVHLKGLYNAQTFSLCQYPQGFAQLTCLRELQIFYGGRDWSSFGILKKLNRLSRRLELNIKLDNLDEEVVEDAREAELVKKIHLQKLVIKFHRFSNEKEEPLPLCMDVLDALRPHTDLQKLDVVSFRGSKLPSWIVSPSYQIREISLDQHIYCSSLPPFGILSCLEVLHIWRMNELEYVGQEFLGVTPSSSLSSSMASCSSSGITIGFPKLKELELYDCPKLREWEDITAEEEKSTILSVMPCLTLLMVNYCSQLTELPYRLLRKGSPIEELNLYGSDHLTKRYKDKEDPFRKLISHIPNVKLL